MAEKKYTLESLKKENEKLQKKLKAKTDELDLYKQIVESIKTGITISASKENDYKILYTNKAFEEITGYTRDEVINKNCRFLQSDEDNKEARQTIRDALKNETSCQVELKNYTKDGELFYNFVSISPIFNKEGKATHFIGTQNDITQLKTQEKLLSQQLKLAAMGEMIGNIAHQWRQPLSIISTCATGMKMQKEHELLTDAEFFRNCEHIDENAQYLSQTIEDFRNYLKGDTKPIKFNLKNDTDSFIKLVDATIKQYHLKVILELHESIKIQGYPNELIQCFINIFNNAKDALVANNDEDNRIICISQHVEDDNVIIKFRDNAGGIDQEYINKIFEPYFTTKHKSVGTGLGLSMTYNLIVNGMGGTITATNETYTLNEKKHSGASFTIVIPLTDNRKNTI